MQYMCTSNFLLGRGFDRKSNNYFELEYRIMENFHVKFSVVRINLQKLKSVKQTNVFNQVLIAFIVAVCGNYFPEVGIL